MHCDMRFDKEQYLMTSHGLKGIGVTTFCRGDIAAANSGEI
jgi:hypothetical protein